MIARYSERTNIVELFGNGSELDFLSKELLIDEAEVVLEKQNSNPLPYSENLEFIKIRHFLNELVKISVRDNYLLIEGSLEKIVFLSKSLEAEEKEIKDYHIHIEYYDDHFFLSPESSPLIVQFT